MRSEGKQNPVAAKKKFKRLRRQFRAAERNGDKFSEELKSEMLKLDDRLTRMDIGWNRNFPVGLVERS